jgi:hypothetical protein
MAVLRAIDNGRESIICICGCIEVLALSVFNHRKASIITICAL